MLQRTPSRRCTRPSASLPGWDGPDAPTLRRTTARSLAQPTRPRRAWCPAGCVLALHAAGAQITRL